MFIKSVYPVKDVFINYFSHIYSNYCEEPKETP